MLTITEHQPLSFNMACHCGGKKALLKFNLNVPYICYMCAIKSVFSGAELQTIMWKGQTQRKTSITEKSFKENDCKKMQIDLHRELPSVNGYISPKVIVIPL